MAFFQKQDFVSLNSKISEAQISASAGSAGAILHCNQVFLHSFFLENKRETSNKTYRPMSPISWKATFNSAHLNKETVAGLKRLLMHSPLQFSIRRCYK